MTGITSRTGKEQPGINRVFMQKRDKYYSIHNYSAIMIYSGGVAFRIKSDLHKKNL